MAQFYISIDMIICPLKNRVTTCLNFVNIAKANQHIYSVNTSKYASCFIAGNPNTPAQNMEMKTSHLCQLHLVYMQKYIAWADVFILNVMGVYKSTTQYSMMYLKGNKVHLVLLLFSDLLRLND